ncbi:MAG TPA: SRPBCC domain-containing protein [Polyangiaceae bacterium]|nr:SRPBCC domain-containing protein [Polyangiaceae bacterium]
MADILHKISINAPKERVYQALSTVDGLSGWWTSTTSGESAHGKTLEFRFGKHVSPMRVEELEANRRVVWRSEEKSEWLDTRITFELSEDAGRTTLLFGHRAWKDGTPFFAHCSMKWATFLLSLREYAETGHGRPFPHDLQI